VQLKQELDFLKRYLEIEEIRFGDRLTSAWTLNRQHSSHGPNLILQPLVENAIRYAIEPNKVQARFNSLPLGTMAN